MEFGDDSVQKAWDIIKIRVKKFMCGKISDAITFKEYSLYFEDITVVVNALKYRFDDFDYLECLEFLYYRKVQLTSDEEYLKYVFMQQQLKDKIKAVKGEYSTSFEGNYNSERYYLRREYDWFGH